MPVTLPASEAKTYDSLLDGVVVSFESVGGREEPAWRYVVVNGDAHIISMKEVSMNQFTSILARLQSSSRHQASNGVLYMIDGTVKID